MNKVVAKERKRALAIILAHVSYIDPRALPRIKNMIRAGTDLEGEDADVFGMQVELPLKRPKKTVIRSTRAKRPKAKKPK